MQRILWCSFSLLVACYITGPLVDPDLWWHITAGRWILTNGAVPTQDYWSLFGAGTPWRAYSWSNEIVYALAERWGGLQGLLALKYLLALGIVASFGVVFSRLSGDWFLGAVLAAFGAGACVSHFTLRPQSLVWILFAWLIYCADGIARDGFTRARAIPLAMIMILWANTHVTTVLGLAVLAALIYRRGEMWQGVKVVGFAFACTFVTPYFGGEWIALLSQAAHPFDMRSIAEFAPATIMQYPTAFLVLAAVLFGVLVTQGSRTVQPLRIVGLVCATVMGLAVIKFLPLASIYVVSLVAIEWRYAARMHPSLPLIDSISRLKALIAGRIPPEGFSFLMIAGSIVFVWNGLQAPLSSRVIPAAAVDFIQQQNLPGPLLNDFGRGGYLMYRFAGRDGAPGPLVSIDGRTNLIPGDLWKKHQAAQFGKETWREYLDLVKPRTILWSNESPLIAILIASQEWCRVFNNRSDREGFSVFVSREEYKIRASELASDNCAGT